MDYYNDVDFYNLDKNQINGEIISNFKTIIQQDDNTCGPCCLFMILNHLQNKTNCSVYEISKMVKTRPFPYGTSFKEMVKFLSKLNYDVESSIDSKRDKKGYVFSSYLEFRDFVLSNLKENNPIIVENVDYGGHYKIIIGLDMVSDNIEEDILVFADPADFGDGNKDGYSIFPAERFFYMWFDDHCIEKKYRKNPYIIAKPKK